MCPPIMQWSSPPVCIFDEFHWRSTSTSKCHVIHQFNFNWHLHFLLKCHLNVTCLVIRVISISKASIDVWFFLLHESHYMSNSKSCMSIDVYFMLAQVFACQTFVKNLQKLWQKYTLILHSCSTPPRLQAIYVLSCWQNARLVGCIDELWWSTNC